MIPAQATTTTVAAVDDEENYYKGDFNLEDSAIHENSISSRSNASSHKSARSTQDFFYSKKIQPPVEIKDQTNIENVFPGPPP